MSPWKNTTEFRPPQLWSSSTMSHGKAHGHDHHRHQDPPEKPERSNHDIYLIEAKIMTVFRIIRCCNLVVDEYSAHGDVRRVAFSWRLRK
jgi:hypothetical protein